jgi:hypothetical protein
LVNVRRIHGLLLQGSSRSCCQVNGCQGLQRELAKARAQASEERETLQAATAEEFQGLKVTLLSMEVVNDIALMHMERPFTPSPELRVALHRTGCRKEPVMCTCFSKSSGLGLGLGF